MQIRGTLRPSPRAVDLEGKTTLSESSGGEDEGGRSTYIDRLTRLFPVEGVTLYPLAVGIAGDDRNILIGMVIFIAVFMGVLRYFATQTATGGSPKLIAVGVSIFAFLLYAFTLGAFGYIFDDIERHTLLSSFVTIIFTGSLGAMKFDTGKGGD